MKWKATGYILKENSLKQNLWLSNSQGIYLYKRQAFPLT